MDDADLHEEGASGDSLNVTDRLKVMAVLDDCVDQLAVLGGIMPVSKERVAENVDVVVGDEIGEVVDGQRQLESEYDALLVEREKMQDRNATQAELKENEVKVRDVAKRLKQSTQVLVKNLRQNPGAAENMVKMQSERAHVQELLAATSSELRESASFYTLIESVWEETESKRRLTETIMKEEEARQFVKELKGQLKEINELKEHEISELDEHISQLKDQLQETKARVALEGKYIKMEASVRVSGTHKRYTGTTQELQNRLDRLIAELTEETTVNDHLVQFLERNYGALKRELETWDERLEKETQAKQAELDELNLNRVRDIGELQLLLEKETEYENVCQDDRKRRERNREQAQDAVKILVAAVKVQAWWRGMLVRHKMGPFKSGKKGKKGKGKKKK